MGYLNGSTNLESKYQYLVSEVILLRLFSILETAISQIALKLACGADYENGKPSIRLVNCSNITDAEVKMMSFGRSKNKTHLKWTNDKFIKESIKYVLDVNDSFFVNIQNNKSIIEEMRKVRNHVAHKTSGTAKDCYDILYLRYNSKKLRLSVGAFLCSNIRNNPSNIERYLLSAPIILKDLCKG